MLQLSLNLITCIHSLTFLDIMPPKRDRYDYSLLEKLWLLDYADRNPGVSAFDLGQRIHCCMFLLGEAVSWFNR